MCSFVHFQIRSMQPLTSLTAVGLESLFMASNKITAIEGIDLFSDLKILELGFNRIRQIENIGHLTLLEELWLGRNRITEIERMETLTHMRKLSLQSNRLQSLKGNDTVHCHIRASTLKAPFLLAKMNF